MRLLLALSLTLFTSVGCNNTTEHVNAYTLEACDPEAKSYMPREKNSGNHKCQGTGNGDNCDDLSSGKVDCIGDGNSGQGDDKKHNCQFPQPGCDANGCCEDDVVTPPGGGGDDGGGGDGGGDDGDGGGTGDTGDGGTGDTGDGGGTGDGGDTGDGPLT